ncbi:MmcB family DNA repair protein [Pelagibacterium montanilacus]|uniref:MmcB family DNA repair protein n=1 Tax=Pelagibacterium montanilacus TaxID=2185280 RepID=UPI000F8DD75C|nr:MmcB family DNA repair protein [Pelagibacterium montanilacus]
MSDSDFTDSGAGPAASGGPFLVDGRQSPTALRTQRGVMRFLRSVHDMACFVEVPLVNGRRADVIALGAKGEIWIIEIKSSLADYRADSKWPAYKDFCDRFFFCKPPELDSAVFPSAEGLLVADGHFGDIIRPAPLDALPPARRKAMLLKLARLGADRVHALMDPAP